ncbi:hypothetical protein C5167_036146 [Papaver somniferum]|uniref:uncharacterized protein LOC113331384 n=1 Tax=Papaver somniferum TaxID=3469 RepID=UPI000E6FD576|nr:uncharacterized protein LOC113331384 [Papaver somniferum]RZC87614.1 hypothetical protein C5167_036146 [Papaver somniferum]
MKLFTAAKDLKFLDANQIIGEAMKIPAKSPSPLFLISIITLIFALSLIQLLCKISFSDFVPTLYPKSIHEFVYNLSFFLLFLLSTSVILFTVASLYASKSVSFISTLFAIPRIFEHLPITFLYALLLKSVTYYLILFTPTYVFDSLNINEGALWWGAVGLLIIIAIIYFVVHLYVMALWHLASVISVVEPNVYGLAAMKKSKKLLQGRILIAFQLANLYFAATFFIGKVFGYVMQSPDHFMVKILLGLACSFWLVSVNLTSLLVQSVFFLACKSHHNQVVRKKVMYHHLCGYDLRDKSKIMIG